MMFLINSCLIFVGFVCLIVLGRLFIYRTALIYVIRRWCQWIDDRYHVHQHLKVPQLNENGQENQLYRNVYLYVNSLSSLEDSDFTNLLSGEKSNDIVLSFDDGQIVSDTFLGARVSWINKVVRNDEDCVGKFRRVFVLKMKKKDKKRILKPYLQHILNVVDDIQQRNKELKLFINNSSAPSDSRNVNGRWRSFPFTHPSTLETIAMDADLKTKIRSDLETFLKSKQHYHKLGRVWKRSYLLYGPPGTGKSSFIAAMARFLNYDVYDVDLLKVSDDSDLKLLLLQTKAKSLIVIEDLDQYLSSKSSAVSLSGLLNFMDGVVNSCCGDEKIMIFTMNCKDHIDPTVMRPGRIDVHIYFPPCDFNSFKTLANSYLGIKEHKLFPQVEEMFQTGAKMSPAEIGELMLANRSSPSRALRSVIAALQSNGGDGRIGRRTFCDSASSSPSITFTEDHGGGGWRDGVPVAKEFRKLYGMLRLKSSKTPPSGPLDRDSPLIVR